MFRVQALVVITRTTEARVSLGDHLRPAALAAWREIARRRGIEMACFFLEHPYPATMRADLTCWWAALSIGGRHHCKRILDASFSPAEPGPAHIWFVRRSNRSAHPFR